MQRFIVLSGCSGGGKSTLLAELGARGLATVEEPGRRIVEEELAGTGAALPWVDGVAFARRAISMALADRVEAGIHPGRIFFDRGLIDAAVALEHLTGEPMTESLGFAHRYHDRVFLVPPWPEIYVGDDARKHGLDEAVAEYDRLCAAYAGLGYEIVILPRSGVAERADFLLSRLREEPTG